MPISVEFLFSPLLQIVLTRSLREDSEGNPVPDAPQLAQASFENQWRGFRAQVFKFPCNQTTIYITVFCFKKLRCNKLSCPEW